jgi:uncharacterized membrane protein YfcA
MLTVNPKLAIAYLACAACVCLWGLAFARVIDPDLVPFAAVMSLGSIWLAWHVAKGEDDTPDKRKLSMILIAWCFVVVLAVGLTAKGDGCFVDWDGRSNSTVC